MNKKVLIIGGIMILVIVTGSFWFLQKDNVQEGANDVVSVETEIQDGAADIKTNVNDINESNKQLTNEEIQELQKNKNLVWYEIPELNIKFLIKKDIAKILEVEDVYIENGKVDGKRLYAIDNDKEINFAKIIRYKIHKPDGEIFQEGCRGDACCPADPNIRTLLVKTPTEIICYYENAINNYEIKNKSIELLKKGYLKTSVVESIFIK